MKQSHLPEDLKRCVAFHGHLCPGVVIGYCAARLALEELRAERSGDEEVIAIVENDTCAVDAIQVLTGCTFGKGNLYFLDYGKMAFSFAVRRTGKSIRLRLRPIRPPDIESVPEDQRRDRHIEYMLEQDSKNLFEIRKDALTRLPATARIRESLPCDACGEMVMATRIREYGGRNLCIPCHEHRLEQT